MLQDVHVATKLVRANEEGDVRCSF